MRTMTFSSLAPLALPDLDRRIIERLVAHLRDPESFALPYPVPSVSGREPMSMPGYAPGFVWRGPPWTNTNWLIGEGLRKHDGDDFYQTLLDAICALIQHSGFRE
ncbi:MAG: MGH1-like glycoside hydrolase domain-containing protein [Dehalococcoidia bacterium]